MCYAFSFSSETSSNGWYGRRVINMPPEMYSIIGNISYIEIVGVKIEVIGGEEMAQSVSI